MGKLFGGKIQSRQVGRWECVPPIVGSVIALIAIAHFTQNPLSLLLLLCFALSPQPLPFPVSLSLSVGARQRGNLSRERNI